MTTSQRTPDELLAAVQELQQFAGPRDRDTVHASIFRDVAKDALLPLLEALLRAQFTEVPPEHFDISEHEEGVKFCPVCKGLEVHAPGCSLKAALRAVDSALGAPDA